MDRILKVAKRLKTFTLEDIVMFCKIDAETAEKFLQESENIQQIGNKFKYTETIKACRVQFFAPKIIHNQDC